MTPQDAPAGPQQDLMLLDSESDDHDLIIREGLGKPDRVVFACNRGDAREGGSIAVSLDTVDVDRAIRWLTAWRDKRRG